MKRITIGNNEFVLLDDSEVLCIHEWEVEYSQVQVNPNGEYVVGYGYVPVFARIPCGHRCIKCCKFIEDEQD